MSVVSTIGWHLHVHHGPRAARQARDGATGAGAGGMDRLLAVWQDDLALALQYASAAVAVAREAWEAADPERQDAAWTWLQACVEHRDLLLHLARTAAGVPVAPPACATPSAVRDGLRRTA